MATNFADLMSTKAEDAEKPDPLPPGTYDVQIIRYELGDQNQNSTPYCRLFCQLIGARDDVDQEALDRIDDLQTRTSRVDFYLTNEAKYRLREFFEKTLGINIAGRSFQELVTEELVGQSCGAYFTQQQSRRTGEMVSYIDRMVK